MKIFSLTLLLAWNIAAVYAQSTSLTGTLLEKPWTKSSQSYCAGGSEYFVLKTDLEEIVLENTTKTNLQDFHNKKVKLTGVWHTRTIKGAQDDNVQRPVNVSIYGSEEKSEDFTCRVFKVSQISLAAATKRKQ